MARKSIFISDLSGEEIPEGGGAVVQIALEAKPQSRFTLEVAATEIEDLIGASVETKKRGRPAKVKATSS
jgi:hypothetical protein